MGYVDKNIVQYRVAEGKFPFDSPFITLKILFILENSSKNEEIKVAWSATCPSTTDFAIQTEIGATINSSPKIQTITIFFKAFHSLKNLSH